MWVKRIQKEIDEITKTSAELAKEGITLVPNESDIKQFYCTIMGPEGTPYAGLKYELDIKIGDSYPMKAPNVKFVNRKRYHPNVNLTGDICLDILKSEWAPTLSLAKMMLSICSLLNEPNPSSPLNSMAANDWVNNKAKYQEEVHRLWRNQ